MFEVKNYYSDYYWDEGRPVGKGSPGGRLDSQQEYYKVVADPYFKWISIEKYQGEEFVGILYDSKIFDFRNLKPANQTAWEKVPLSKDSSLIRDQDDRIILFEEYFFEGDRCRQCRTRSVHGVPISLQKIYYKELGDSVNAVALFDNNSHLVMYKLYDTDPETGEFRNVLEEKWNMRNGEDLFQKTAEKNNCG
jgi:hypothetical protein